MSERPPVSPKAPREEAEALASDESTRLFVTDETTQHSTLSKGMSRGSNFNQSLDAHTCSYWKAVNRYDCDMEKAPQEELSNVGDCNDTTEEIAKNRT
ncbi:hypothetical protein DTO013E5_7701 [Penicillium roqueforti]|uniref:uncharacterized protein n=1 Tax=Penicillium roqueforti TaxID=5082 RepID=UPI00190CBB6C|nr:uncharacterized protein LCP9604111_9277 [Penicillium roqueforti]KAF9239045.1 hypothetical protein LCP9604111_9277 [Penicillium roqueforti]KAI1830051.1 hypothetical protein CBS147337_9103 [Penicillium roqueforti]KAI2670402.1 hypothetical protein CBS147355_9313 [Penicillium roqueforti]KAI2673902.1 hypothetical protein LCP963914a_8976 [Penicillium roqueforti]KAI2695910.1 hypothetical protein CBS147372_8787 [Penicillium roqueforti]